MSYKLAHAVGLPRIATGVAIGSARQLTSAATRRLLNLIAALIVASAVTACTGGAGLNVPAQPVDHGCHTGAGVVLGGEGSGCG